MANKYRPPRDGFYNNATLYGENVNGFFSYEIQLMDLPTAYQDVLTSGDQQLIEFVEDAIATTDRVDGIRRGFQIFATGVAAVLFLLCVARLIEICWNGWLKANKANRNVLLLLTFYNGITLTMTTVDIFVQRSSPEVAQVLWRVGSVLYLVGNLCLYIILLLRANMVLNNVIFINHRKIHLLKNTIRAALFLFVAFFAMPFFAIYNAYFPPARNLIHLNPIAAIFFLVCDTMFSLTLLALFIYPFFVVLGGKGSSDLGTGTSDNMLKRIMRKNLMLSGIMMLSTFTTMVFSAYADSFCDGLPRIDNLDHQYFRELTQLGITLDILVNTVCAHAIGTSFWIPRFLIRVFRRNPAEIMENDTALVNEKTDIDVVMVDSPEYDSRDF